METHEGINGVRCVRDYGIEELANKTTNGDCASLASTMNTFFVSLSEHLPRLDRRDPVFTVNDELPNKYVYLLT